MQTYSPYCNFYNRDGTVSLEELENFLFPEHYENAANETGIVLELTRKALIQMIGLSGAAALGSDEAIFAEFVKLLKVKKSISSIFTLESQE